MWSGKFLVCKKPPPIPATKLICGLLTVTSNLCAWQPGTVDENFSMVWDKIREVASAKKVDNMFANLHIGMFCKKSRPNSGFPKLKGRAAEVKAMGIPLLATWEAFMSDSLLHRQVLVMLRCSVSLDVAMAEHRHLNAYPAPIFGKFMADCENFLVLYSAAASAYNGIGVRVFNVVPKFHLLWHACHQAQFVNPAMSWCFSGEDGMLHWRRLGSASLRGTPSWHISRKILFRWIRGFTWRHR